MIRSRKAAIAAFGLAAALTGCADQDVNDVKAWMEDTRRQTPVKVAKIAEPKTFVPFTYGGRDSIDPYDPSKLAVALAKLQGKTASGIKPDLERPREPLESLPLDTLTMVGTLEKVGLSHALVQADKNVFQVKVGNYIGQNFGRITRISESGVDLKEIVQDASGEWVERPARLELQETKK